MQWVPSFKMHLCCAFVALNWWGRDPSKSSSAVSCTSSYLLLIIAKALKLPNWDLEQIQGYHQEKADLILRYSNMIFEWKKLQAPPPKNPQRTERYYWGILKMSMSGSHTQIFWVNWSGVQPGKKGFQSTSKDANVKTLF